MRKRNSRLGAAAVSFFVVLLPLAGVARAAATPVASGTERVTLALAPNDPTGLRALAHASGLTGAQRVSALARVVPSAQARVQVEASARHLGLVVQRQSRWAVQVTGPSGRIQDLFGSSRGNNPRSHFSQNLPRLPAGFAGRVTAAFGGDDTRPVAVPMFGGPKGTGGLTGSQLQTQYGINPASSRATGQTIATVQLSDWDPADLTTYKSGEGLTAPLNYTGVEDPSDPPVPDPLGSEEVDLDQETLYGAAPEAAQRAYMSGNDAGGLYDDITAIGDDASNPTHDFHITAASISWGLCEDTSAADAPLFDALEDALQYVLATGVTIFASSGDLGADCAANQTGVSYPASSPEVVAVGGTQFDPGATTLPATEEAWNDGNGHGSAGGASALFFQPSWQVNDGLSGQTMRTVPDISSLAGGPGYEVYTSSAAWQAFGGTSLASPTSAALLTDVLAEHNYTWGIGDIHPTLYSHTTYAPAVSPTVTDITSGTIANGTATAGPGYDLVTGLGTPIWDNLVPALGGDPHLSVVSPWIRTDVASLIVHTADFQDFGSPGGFRVEEDSTPQCGAFGLSTTPPTSADFSSESPTDGWHVVALLAVDNTGTCHWAYHDVFIDTHAPSAHPSIALTSPTSGAQVTARWSFTDPSPSSGFNHFWVKITNQAGTVIWSTTSTTATSKPFAAVQGWTYTVSVQAYDNAGNASAMAAAKYTVPVDDTHFAYAPGWSSVAAPSAYGASFHYSAHTGTYALYDGAARTYVLWVLTGPYGGRVNVYVGSTLVKVIDLYSSVTRFRVPVTVYSSSLATRMLKFLVTGVKDSSLHAAQVYLDGIQPEQ